MMNEIVTTMMTTTNAMNALQTADEVKGMAKVGKFISDHKVEIAVGAGCTAVGAGVAVACCRHAAEKDKGIFSKNSLEESKKKAAERAAKKEEKKLEKEAKKEEKKCSDVKDATKKEDEKKAEKAA